MSIHGHSVAYGVPVFNDHGVWLRATSTDGKQYTGNTLNGLCASCIALIRVRVT